MCVLLVVRVLRVPLLLTRQRCCAGAEHQRCLRGASMPRFVPPASLR
jgi:hypothetical protein